jgi:uncharacterized protein
MMNRYRILSLDGGGIRGYLSILLLERLAKARPGFLDQIDLFAGTSTGSFIALGLAAGQPPEAIRKMYEQRGRYIFQDSRLDNIRDIGFALGAKYSNKHLREVLKEQFGDMHLEDLKRNVLIASFDLDRRPQAGDPPRMWKAKFFHNFPGEESDGFERVVDVALRSSAAPIYFPSYQGYVDGFVVANNPSMCAIAQALRAGVAGVEDIVLLSVGTGLNPRYIAKEQADWGILRWLFQFYPHSRRLYGLPLIYMMWEGGVNLASYQCHQLLNDRDSGQCRFYRLDPDLCHPVDIDGVRHMNYLHDVAMSTDIDQALPWLDRQFLPEVAAAGQIT